MFGVFDGHGSNGKLVSDFVKSKLPLTISKLFKSGMENIPEVLSEAISRVDTSLLKSKIDSHYSGTTCCLALLRDEIIDDTIVQELYIANTGDSRALLCKFNETYLDTSVDSIPVLYEVGNC